MYNDLADTVESMKEKGFTHTYKIDTNGIRCSELDRIFSVDELCIIGSYSQEAGTDPGFESSVYCIESNDGIKGVLIIGFGMYSNPEQTKLINKLLSKED